MPYRPTHRQLEYLVALGDVRHFGEAARRCHVSQPTLSVQVALLEKQLGVTLIDRSASHIAPTPIGEDVIAAARTLLLGLDEIVALASSGRKNLGGLIRLGIAPTVGPYLMPYFLPSLHARYPALKVHLREDRPTALEDRIRAGEIDCALGPRPADETSFAYAPVCREEIMLGLPSGHRLAGRDEVTLSELAGETLLTLGRGHRLFENVRGLADASGAVFAENYEGTSLDAIRQMVAIEMGMSLFPELYIRSEFAKEQNVALARIRDWPISRDIGLYWRSSSARKPHYEVLAEMAKATARDLLGRD